MRLRTFTAPNMPAAMELVREAMGDDAVIIASEPLAARKLVRVTAAVDEEDESGVENLVKSAAAPKPDMQADQLRHEMQNILRFHNVPDLFVAKMMRSAAELDLASLIALHRVSAGRSQAEPLQRLAVEALLAAYFTFEPLPVDEAGAAWRLMLIGPPGIGKTLTIAKIAARLSMNKLPLTVITTDNKRAGGIEQLQAFTDILGLKLIIADGQAELARQLKSLPARLHVLIDSAGCNPYDAGEMDELAGLAAMEAIEPVLVLPAGGDSLETVDVVEAFAQLPIRRLLVTRADTARRFGGVLAAAAAHRLSFCHVSNSPGIINALHPLDAQLLAQMLLKYQGDRAHETKESL